MFRETRHLQDFHRGRPDGHHHLRLQGRGIGLYRSRFGSHAKDQADGRRGRLPGRIRRLQTYLHHRSLHTCGNQHCSKKSILQCACTEKIPQIGQRGAETYHGRIHPRGAHPVRNRLPSDEQRQGPLRAQAGQVIEIQDTGPVGQPYRQPSRGPERRHVHSQYPRLRRKTGPRQEGTREPVLLHKRTIFPEPVPAQGGDERVREHAAAGHYPVIFHISGNRPARHRRKHQPDQD